jgi:hypothetical protein
VVVLKVVPLLVVPLLVVPLVRLVRLVGPPSGGRGL